MDINNIVQLIVLFIFVFVLIRINFPQIDDSSLLEWKLYIFMGVFFFYLFLEGAKDVYQGKKTEWKLRVNESLTMALIAVVGHSVYHDFVRENKIKLDGVGRDVGIVIVIMFFVVVKYLIDHI